jgi:hypothetical protein
MASTLSPAALARYTAWQADTRKRGGTPTRMPTGTNKGDLAERFGARAPFRYMLAPAQIRADDRGVAISLIVDQVKGKAADAITGAVTTVQQTARAVAAAPRDAIGAVLGIPKWAVTALVIAGLAYVAYRATTSARPLPT